MFFRFNFMTYSIIEFLEILLKPDPGTETLFKESRDVDEKERFSQDFFCSK